MKYKFWKENKISREYSLTVEEITQKYKEYLKTKEVDWIKHYGHQTVNSFIGDKGGLNSVTDTENYEPLQDLLKDVRSEYIESLKQ